VSIGLAFTIGAVKAAISRDGATWVPLLTVGVVLVAASVAALVWARAGIARDEALRRELESRGVVTTPFGAKPRERGVVLRPRAAVRVVPLLLTLLIWMTAVGMALDGLRAPAVVVGALSLMVIGYWWWGRSYELCLDNTGIWRRRRPRWRLAWQDLRSVDNKPTSNRWHPARPDDIVLRGAIASPGGRHRDTVRIRCNLLAIAPDDFRRLADRYWRAATPGSGSSSFLTWS
jgi:hypothetical protein